MIWVPELRRRLAIGPIRHPAIGGYNPHFGHGGVWIENTERPDSKSIPVDLAPEIRLPYGHVWQSCLASVVTRPLGDPPSKPHPEPAVSCQKAPVGVSVFFPR